jgi:surfeit locus 1 family protein
MRGALIPTVAAACVVALTGTLGQWQLRRAAEKDEAAARHAAALAQPPTRLGAVAAANAGALDGRLVSVTGVFLPEATVLLDNRTRQGVAGWHVLTPLRVAAADAPSHVLVLRGWVARDPVDRGRLPAIATPPGEVTVEGIAQAALAQPIMLGEDPEPAKGDRLWQRWSAERYARWSGLAMQPVLVRQLSELPDGLARDWTQAGSGADRHRAYAFQWFALAVVTAGLWVAFVPLGRWRAARDAQRQASSDARNCR